VGGCVLEVGAAFVDARIEASLARVRNVLNEAAGKP
jgi:flagellar biosynthesis/type III secretory pathway protein FliH